MTTDRRGLDSEWIVRWSAPTTGRGLGWLVPVLAAASLAVTLTLSPDKLMRVAPWVCSAAVVFETWYLARMSLTAVRAAHALSAETGPHGTRGLSRALLQMANLVVGMTIFAGALPFVAAHALAEAGTPAAARLLWFICVGGLMVAIAFGELMRLLAGAAEAAVEAGR